MRLYRSAIKWLSWASVITLFLLVVVFYVDDGFSGKKAIEFFKILLGGVLASCLVTLFHSIIAYFHEKRDWITAIFFLSTSGYIDVCRIFLSLESNPNNQRTYKTTETQLSRLSKTLTDSEINDTQEMAGGVFQNKQLGEILGYKNAIKATNSIVLQHIYSLLISFAEREQEDIKSIDEQRIAFLEAQIQKQKEDILKSLKELREYLKQLFRLSHKLSGSKTNWDEMDENVQNSLRAALEANSYAEALENIST